MAELVVKRVLMVAFHYPPAFGSSGVQRSLKFSRYLREHGWEPGVITANPRAHPRRNDGQMAEIPESVRVSRAFALDAARHLAIRDRYPRWLALPDRWASWVAGAVPVGLARIRRERPQLIWSTYPIATAHLIGWILHRLTGVPWVADCRDSMTEDDYPADPATRRVFQAIERRTVNDASRVVFTAPGTQRMYAARYPDLPAARWACIPNGYDEENFAGAESAASAFRGPPGALHFVHSGILYPSERDPRAFFAALAGLRDRGAIRAGELIVTLRASGHDEELTRMIAAAGVEDFVRLAPGLPYRDALAEMLAADGLLLFQASNCNHQIPAKLYEYLRSGRPVLGLTDPAGDTAATLRENGFDTLVRLDDREDISRGLTSFIERVRSGSAPVASRDQASRYSRGAQAASLAALFDALPGCGSADRMAE